MAPINSSRVVRLSDDDLAARRDTMSMEPDFCLATYRTHAYHRIKATLEMRMSKVSRSLTLWPLIPRLAPRSARILRYTPMAPSGLRVFASLACSHASPIVDWFNEFAVTLQCVDDKLKCGQSSRGIFPAVYGGSRFSRRAPDILCRSGAYALI
jgi:hypothetical protein